MNEIELSVIDAELVDGISVRLPERFWYCGRCKSLIPLTYWHQCDADHTHTAPYRDR